MEIERKFLVPGEEAAEFSKHGTVVTILQYYTENSENTEIRRRMIISGTDVSYLETKKVGSGLAREEYEYAIDEKTFHKLLPLSGTLPKPVRRVSGVISKFRTTVEKDGYTFEVDSFGNPKIFYPDGRIASIVEVEFDSIENAEKFSPSDYFREFIDVTTNKRYKNKNLAQEALAFRPTKITYIKGDE